MSTKILVLLGNQLFPEASLTAFRKHRVYLAEDFGLCTYFRFHKHKLALFLSAMRHRAEELRRAGFEVDYWHLNDDGQSYESRLISYLKAKGCNQVDLFEIEDRDFESRLIKALDEAKIKIVWHSSPMFLTSRAEFCQYLSTVKKPFMKTFYEWQRRRLKILVDPSGKPEGGRWSFDTENRKRLPKGLRIPARPTSPPDAITNDVIKLISKHFSDHPGQSTDFSLTVTRAEALRWLEQFLSQKLADFGPYEDAISQDSAFLFHSILSPALNLGLITPHEVIEATLKGFRHSKKPTLISSVEGFIRQIIGWREFIRGIDRNYGHQQEEANFFNHKRGLTDAWYEGNTGVPILDDSIKKVQRFGFTHHIERLMVLSNLMLLSEIHPHAVYRWFMEMFVDSSDWVMGPNVYGMGQHSDGGIFATKPYICGSNYLLKMSDYSSGPWTDTVDGLYWRFIDKNRTFYLKNPRTSMAVRLYDKMTPAKKSRLGAAAESFIAQFTADSD